MSSAARHARAAWSGCACGAFQNAITASPMNLSTVPSWRKIAAVSRLMSSFSRVTSACGDSRREMAVKPRTSEKSTVISRVSPPRARRAGSSSTQRLTVGER